MTNRHAGYLVVLDDPIREDEAERIIIALEAIKGVVSVQPIDEDWQQQAGALRARVEVANHLSQFIQDMLGNH